MTDAFLTNKGLGWKPDLPDHRDLAYTASARQLPAKVDLRPAMPPVYDQGQLGSCTANAIAAALQYLDILENEPNPPVPSRLFIYYNERVLEHSVHSDAGARIRDGIKTIAKQGFCAETDWPYQESKFAIKPPPKAYSDARTDLVVSYKRLSRLSSDMTTCLAEGFPFVFGFTVYESFMSAQVAKDGMVPLPKLSEAVVGGHAVLAVGYDAASSLFICRNSWGAGWGDQGYFYMPWGYLTRAGLASDFWTVRKSAA